MKSRGIDHQNLRWVRDIFEDEVSTLFGGSYLLGFKGVNLEKQFQNYRFNKWLAQTDRYFLYSKIVIDSSALLDTLSGHSHFSIQFFLCFLSLGLTLIHFYALNYKKEEYERNRWKCVLLHRIIGCCLISLNGVSASKQDMETIFQQSEPNQFQAVSYLGVKIVFLMSGVITVIMHALGFIVGLEINLFLQFLSLLSFVRNNNKLCAVCNGYENCQKFYGQIQFGLKHMYQILIPVVLPDRGLQLKLEISSANCQAIIITIQVVFGILFTTLILLQFELYARTSFLHQQEQQQQQQNEKKGVDGKHNGIIVDGNVHWKCSFKSLQIFGSGSQQQCVRMFIAQGLIVCSVCLAVWTFVMPSKELSFKND